MKKILVGMFLLVFGLCLVGCETIVKTRTLASVVEDAPFSYASVMSLRSDVFLTVEYNDLKDQEFYKRIMNSNVEIVDVLPEVIPLYTLIISADTNSLQIVDLDSLYAIYNNVYYLVNCDNEDRLLLFNYLVEEKQTYKLIIQNKTEYELIGIKEEYKAGEEVEVKMFYEDDVVTYVHLNGENIGYLSGTNSVKFMMPNEDSNLTISYSEEIYKVNVIDNFNLIGKQLNDYYVYGERIAFPVSYELYDTIKVTVNGVLKEGIPPLMSNYDCKIYSFNMPENDCEVIIYVNGLSDYSCNDNLHHYEEEIIKVEETDSYIKKSICKLCGKTIEEEITKIKLNTKTIFYNHYSNGNLFEEFVSEFKVSNKRYLIIDNVDTYFNVYPNIPNIGNEFFDKQEADEFFKDNIMVLHIRYISGTMDFISVNYFYNIENFDICKEYVKNVPENYPQVFLGNTIDIITIPKEYYNEIIK